MKRLLAAAGALTLVATALPALAAGPAATATANADAAVVKPITITNVAPLRFGRVVPVGVDFNVSPGADGSNTGSYPSSALDSGTPNFGRATFTINGEQGLAWHYVGGFQNVVLTSGANQMTVHDIYPLQGNYYRTAGVFSGSPEPLEISGALQVGANQAPGIYTGSFTATIAYD
jgi:spore coat protein U-like protein